MFAASITRPGRIELVDIPEQRLSLNQEGPGEILFQPEVGCLCGSDLPFFTMNGEVTATVGHSLHEMVGRVVATNGTKFRPGDRVLGVPVDQLGFFERYVLSEERAIFLDDRVSLEHAMLAQPLGTVLFALRKLPPLFDQTVAVVGAGPIGQLFCAALRNLGARNIISIDKLPSRLEYSHKMGATHVLCNSEESPVERVQNINGGQLADVVVEAVGHQDQAFNLCIDLCRHGGQILYFGVPPHTIDGLRWRELFRKNLTVHTSVGPDFQSDFPLAMRWIGEGRVNLLPLISHRFPVEQCQQAFETFRDRIDGAQKVVLNFPAANS